MRPALSDRVVQTVFPRCYVANIQPLTDGLRNANFKLQLDCTAESIVPACATAAVAFTNCGAPLAFSVNELTFPLPALLPKK